MTESELTAQNLMEEAAEGPIRREEITELIQTDSEELEAVLDRMDVVEREELVSTGLSI